MDFSKIEGIVAGDSAYLREMLIIYLEENEGLLEKLPKALQQSQISELRHIVHSSAASSSLLATDEFQNSLEYCRDLVLKHQASSEEKKAALRRSQMLFEKIRQQVQAYLKLL